MMDNYIDLAIRTESPITAELMSRLRSRVREIHSIFGLTTEVGELADAYKRFIFYGKQEVDRINVIEELGDILWYFGPICDAVGITLEEIQERNIAKLRARYPNKFDDLLAIERDLAKERAALEESMTKESKLQTMLDNNEEVQLSLREEIKKVETPPQ